MKKSINKIFTLIFGLIIFLMVHCTLIIDDCSAQWQPDVRLTNDPASSRVTFNNARCIASIGDVVHIVWGDTRDGNYEIYYKRSIDGGTTWGADIRLTNDTATATPTSSGPSIAVSSTVLHVTWLDNRDGNPEIYYKRSTDAGISWGEDTRLTINLFVSEFPSISISGSVVHVIWQDQRDGNYEIYYKRNPTGNIVGIMNLNSETLSGFSLSQNYPNPFNPTTSINFAIPKSSLVRISVFDILGKEVATLVNEQLQPGTYEVTFYGSNLPSGIYFYQLNSDNFSDTKKLTLLK